jgi:hypothetical protein
MLRSAVFRANVITRLRRNAIVKLIQTSYRVAAIRPYIAARMTRVYNYRIFYCAARRAAVRTSRCYRVCDASPAFFYDSLLLLAQRLRLAQAAVNGSAFRKYVYIEDVAPQDAHTWGTRQGDQRTKEKEKGAE